MKKESQSIKGKTISDIRNRFELENVEYYKPIKVGNFYSINDIEFDCNDDRDKKLLIQEYLSKVQPYLKDIMINLQKSDTWEIQLTIANNFISSIDIDKEQHCIQKMII